MSEIRQGAKAPFAYQQDLTPGPDNVDLSTVSAVVFKVEDPRGGTQDWATTLSNQTTTTLTATFTFDATTSEIPFAGRWRIYAELTTPSGTPTADVAILTVKSPWEE